MINFEWKDEYSVSNKLIDSHHKKLISLFNEIGIIISSEPDTTSITSTIKVVSELNVYTIFHFREEEKLMEKGNYPDLENHKKLHAGFVEKIKLFKDGYMNNDNLVNYDIYEFLSNWLINHILIEDIKYIDYID